ncbi:MAG: class I tRNA ligase family protein, partial [Thermoanaerobaculia bacterium]
SLRLLHPLMPFVTEEIWLKLGGVEPSIMIAPYPVAEDVLEDPEAERLTNAVKSIITTVRNVRAERGFTPKDRFTLYISGSDERDSNFFRENAYLLLELARLNEVNVGGEPPAGTHHDVIDGFHIAIAFPEKVVSQEQLDRVRREIEKTEKELAAMQAKLADERFMSNAPAHIVDGARTREAELRERLVKLQRNQ